MSGFLQIAVALYLVCAVLQARLLRSLSSQARAFPAFFALNLLAVASLVMLFPSFFAWKSMQIPTELYALMYWKFRTVQMACLGFVLGEATKSKNLFVICGAVGVGCAAWFELSGSITVHRGFGVAVALMACVLMIGKRSNRAILAGVAVASFFPAISESMSVIQGNNDLLRFVPTFSYVVALVIWLRGVNLVVDEPCEGDTDRDDAECAA